MKRRIPSPMALIAATAVATIALPSLGAESGDRWRVTSSMTMGSMTTPSRTSEICAPRRADAPPVKTENNCQVTDNKRVGNKQTTKLHCSGEHPSDATLEIVYDRADHYRGKMTVTSQKGQVVMNTEGEKLAGDCDPNIQTQQNLAMAEQLKSQGTANMQASCTQAASSLETSAFVGPLAQCKDPDAVRAYCEHMRTHDGFAKLASREQNDANLKSLPAEMRESMGHPLAASAKMCSLDVSQLRTNLCASADGKSQAAFILDQCPAQAKAIAQRECSGREPSTVTLSPYSEFCSRYAAQTARANPSASTATGTAPNAPATPAQQGTAGNAPQQPGSTSAVDQAKNAASSAVDKGTNLLKGLFSH
jgi:Protein of unknown function (DUF3617)